MKIIYSLILCIGLCHAHAFARSVDEWKQVIKSSTKQGRLVLQKHNIYNPSLQNLCSALEGNVDVIMLDLSYNHITEVPANFGRGMTNLQRVYMSHNKIDTLPEGFLREQKKLTHLAMRYNNIKALPPRFGERNRALTHLFLDTNDIVSLDEDLGYFFPNLAYLNLRNNRLVKLPESINKLSLKYKDLQENEYTIGMAPNESALPIN